MVLVSFARNKHLRIHNGRRRRRPMKPYGCACDLLVVFVGKRRASHISCTFNSRTLVPCPRFLHVAFINSSERFNVVCSVLAQACVWTPSLSSSTRLVTGKDGASRWRTYHLECRCRSAWRGEMSQQRTLSSGAIRTSPPVVRCRQAGGWQRQQESQLDLLFNPVVLRGSSPASSLCCSASKCLRAWSAWCSAADSMMMRWTRRYGLLD